MQCKLLKPQDIATDKLSLNADTTAIINELPKHYLKCRQNFQQLHQTNMIPIAYMLLDYTLESF